MDKHSPKSKPRRFLRKRSVAERYDVNTRTVDRMAEDGRLPAPIYKGKLPMWAEDELEASDRAAALLPRPR
jgi:predicted DNA-binding transcriptional regulator AlpA